MGLDAGYGIGSVKPGVCTSTTRPGSPYVGQIIYETDTTLTKVWTGSAWVDTPPGKANVASPTFTGTVTASTINSTNYQQSGNAGSIVRYGDVGVTFTTTPTAFLVNMPSGCNVGNMIACHPTTGVNNTVTVTSIRYGDWGGVQSPTQIQITGSLGNGVHLEQFAVRFYWLA